MSIPTILPKGCAAARGVSDIPRVSSTGGQVGQLANRLYMLHARYESLMNKRDAMTVRLKGVISQIAALATDIRRTQVTYNKLSRRNGKGNRGTRKATETPSTGGVTIEF